MLEQLINHFSKYEFVYIFIFVALSFLVLSVVIKKQALKIIFMFLFSVFFAVTVVEYLLSLDMMSLSRQSQRKNIERICVDCKNVSELKINKYARYDINGKQYQYLDTKVVENIINKIFLRNVYETQYPNGFRYTKNDFNKQIEYIFFGCSFVYGLGLEDNQTLPYFFSLLNDDAGVLNCGVIGSGTNTILNILQSNVLDKFIEKNSAKKYFIYLAIPEHINRNFTNEFLNEPSDIYVYDNNKFIKNKYPFGFFNNLFVRSYIFRKLFLNLIDNNNKMFYQEYFINSLLKINAIIENQYRSNFIVVLWNEDESMFNGYIMDALKKTKINYIILPEFDSGYLIENDGHPNEKANKKIAEFLLRHFEQDKKHEK